MRLHDGGELQGWGTFAGLQGRGGAGAQGLRDCGSMDLGHPWIHGVVVLAAVSSAGRLEGPCRKFPAAQGL